MSKRFIDTDLFEDAWFMDLSKDAKIAFIYFITKCNHAGILHLNEKLFSFQTGVKWATVYKELSNRLLTVKEGLFFMPKYLTYQYPSWPNSNVQQQKGAIKILSDIGLWDEENQTVTEPLPKGYVNDSVNVDVNGVNKKGRPKFIPPTLDEVKTYFKENGYSHEGAEKAFKYYSEADWHDSGGKPVRAWKQKLNGNWFRPEFKEAKSVDRITQLQSKPYHMRTTAEEMELNELLKS